MLFEEALPFIEQFMSELNNSLKILDPGAALSKIQKKWISFCLMGILMTNYLCWTKFSRASLNLYSIKALSWMLRRGKIVWDKLLKASIILIFKKYDINTGVLVIDDTDKKRSKNTKRIYKAHKIYDKSTDGYFNGQNIVFLLLVSNKITIPVGFRFYYPDPKIKEWRENDEKLQSQGVAKKDRPKKPERDPKYPSKITIAKTLIKEFKLEFPSIKISAVIADAFYGSCYFMDSVNNIFNDNIQIISQIKSDQLVYYGRKKIAVAKYFKRMRTIEHELSVRGKDPITVEMYGARVKVHSHGKKRFVIAIKYSGCDDYKYIVASDLAWRYKDIVQTYTLRWLVEVFIQDWKANDGWRELKLLDVEGSERAVILSLLFDYSLLFHPAQLRLVEDKLPACTVGSLLRKCRIDAFLQYLKNILNSKNPLSCINKIESAVKEIYQLIPSSKHMNGNNLGHMGMVERLKYRRV